MAGALALGSAIQLVSSTHAIVSVEMTIAGTAIVIASWLGLARLLARYPQSWRVGGNTLIVRRPGRQVNLAFVGIIVMLWLPRAIERLPGEIEEERRRSIARLSELSQEIWRDSDGSTEIRADTERRARFRDEHVTEYVMLSQAIGKEIDFSFATLPQCKSLRGCNLAKIAFRGADLRGADFEMAVLEGADFSFWRAPDPAGQADLLPPGEVSVSVPIKKLPPEMQDWVGAFEACSIKEPPNRRTLLRGAILAGADLRGADFRAAIMDHVIARGAVLSGADMRCASLRSARFDGADFTGTRLRSADLRDATLTDAIGLTREQLIVAIVDESTKPPPHFARIWNEIICESLDNANDTRKE